MKMWGEGKYQDSKLRCGSNICSLSSLSSETILLLSASICCGGKIGNLEFIDAWRWKRHAVHFVNSILQTLVQWHVSYNDRYLITSSLIRIIKCDWFCHQISLTQKQGRQNYKEVQNFSGIIFFSVLKISLNSV